MPFLPRNPNPQSSGGLSLPTHKAFALLVLAALIVLIAMRHLFGSIRVEGGAR
jgi:hypothetical protein